MADLRVTGGASPTALQPARPSEAVRAAQRAFFTAALNNVAPAQAASPVQSQAATRGPAVQPAQPAAGEPARYARPGSLLDIKV
jgi:hypothetical protein